VVGGRVDGREGADQFELVPIGRASDQRVKPILGCQCVGQVWSSTGEAGDPPLVGVGGMRGVPSLVSSVEVASPDAPSGPVRYRRIWYGATTAGLLSDRSQRNAFCGWWRHVYRGHGSHWRCGIDVRWRRRRPPDAMPRMQLLDDLTEPCVAER
jgi:hypothetical protein